MTRADLKEIVCHFHRWVKQEATEGVLGYYLDNPITGYLTDNEYSVEELFDIYIETLKPNQ